MPGRLGDGGHHDIVHQQMATLRRNAVGTPAGHPKLQRLSGTEQKIQLPVHMHLGPGRPVEGAGDKIGLESVGAAHDRESGRSGAG